MTLSDVGPKLDSQSPQVYQDFTCQESKSLIWAMDTPPAHQAQRHPRPCHLAASCLVFPETDSVTGKAHLQRGLLTDGARPPLETLPVTVDEGARPPTQREYVCPETLAPLQRVVLRLPCA